MSSIVINPSRKAENSIYLVFSTVLVTFIFYLAEGLNTGTEFVPDLFVVLAISSLIASALVYSAPDEIVLHWRLKNRSRQDKLVTKLAKFNILTQYLLGSYAIVTRRVRSPRDEVCDAVDSVLEGKDLDTEIWKLRGAFWLVLSLVPSGLIICSILRWAATCVFIAALIMVIVVMVIVPSIKQYNRTSQYTTSLAQFQWFDELLTATRMTETTASKTVTNLDISLDGLSESIYRGVRGAQKKEPKSVKEVPDIVRPIVDKRAIVRADRKESSVDFKGILSDDIHVSREMRRRYNSLLAEESIWLRQLVQMGRWRLFLSRFQKLKSDIIKNAELNKSKIPSSMIDEWSKCLISDEIHHSFSELRRLVFHMKNLNLFIDTDKETIEILLFPSEEDMKNPSVAFVYYQEMVSISHEISMKLKEMFMDYASNYTEEYISNFGPSEDSIPIDHVFGFLESRITRETGQSIEIFHNIEDIDLDDIKEQDYALQED